MGDGLKLFKDKRHRSSSSIAGVTLEGSRSETKKLNIKGSITEVDDQFALAEARCDDLQEKLDLIKGLKRKKKLKKRSTTRVSEALPLEDVPFISVRTQPKPRAQRSRIAPIAEAPPRLRRLEPSNPTRAYVDPATLEQHRMLDQVHGYAQMCKPRAKMGKAADNMAKSRLPTRAHADGDKVRNFAVSDPIVCEAESQPIVSIDMTVPMPPAMIQAMQSTEVGRNLVEDAMLAASSDRDIYKTASRDNQKTLSFARQKANPISPANRRRHVPRDIPLREASNINMDDRPVVELFKKNRSLQSTELKRQTPEKKNVKSRELEGDILNENHSKEKRQNSAPRRVKYRSRRYELPTVASQMKQAGMRYCSGTQPYYTNIPFIISKSTAPSHNLGVNIQQVLNGMKIQQPLSGIPLTIAHHMGLGHIPSCETKNVQPSLDNREINAIRLGRRLLRLPSYKYMSYNRLLTLYRDGDGMVSRFLRAIGRTHNFYTSMYNLATRADFDGAGVPKPRSGDQEALAEYADLYHEYEKLERCLEEGHDESLARRKEELVNELAAREEQIRRLVHAAGGVADDEHKVLRATASTAEDNYRYSTFKLNANAP